MPETAHEPVDAWQKSHDRTSEVDKVIADWVGCCNAVLSWKRDIDKAQRELDAAREGFTAAKVRRRQAYLAVRALDVLDDGDEKDLLAPDAD